MVITSGQRKAALNIFENICLVKQKNSIFFIKEELLFFRRQLLMAKNYIV